MSNSTYKHPKIKCILQWIHDLKVDLLEWAYTQPFLTGTISINIRIGKGNKLTVLGVVMERSNVKVAVIQELRLSLNPGTRAYGGVIPDARVPHGHSGELVIFIHKLISFSQNHPSPESLSDHHLE